VWAQHPMVTVIVDLDFAGTAGQVTDWQIELSRRSWRFRWVFGYADFPYRPEWNVPLNREDLGPWWGAWEPAVLAGIAAGTLILLLLVWCVLGAFYGLFMRGYGYFLDRNAGLMACWRAGQASLWTGALILDAALVLYGLKQLDFIGIVFAFGLHVIIAWFYVVAAPLYFPLLTPARPHNPFAAP
jgi:hypothetical protein